MASGDELSVMIQKPTINLLIAENGAFAFTTITVHDPGNTVEPQAMNQFTLGSSSCGRISWCLCWFLFVYESCSSFFYFTVYASFGACQIVLLRNAR